MGPNKFTAIQSLQVKGEIETRRKFFDTDALNGYTEFVRKVSVISSFMIAYMEVVA